MILFWHALLSDHHGEGAGGWVMGGAVEWDRAGEVGGGKNNHKDMSV